MKLPFLKIQFLILLLSTPILLSGQTINFPKPEKGNYDMHVVAKGETLYSLSKEYHTTVDSLLKLNPGIVNNNLTEGKVIRIPFKAPATIKTQFPSADEKNDHPLYHEVLQGETVYSISRKYYSDVNTILMLNDLNEPAISIGQKLIVGYDTSSLAEATAPEKTASDHSVVQTAKPGEVPHTEKGIARWMHSSYDDGNFYALHPTAPAGTIITVMNLMNNKTISVRVIGRLPSTSENENIVVKLSEAAAKRLNALDEKFLVQLTYSISEDVADKESN